MGSNDLNFVKHLENISHFVEHTGISDANEQLWEILNAAMSSKFINNIGAERRGDLMYFCSLLFSLMEAVYWLEPPIREKFSDALPENKIKQHSECPYCLNKIKFEV